MMVHGTKKSSLEGQHQTAQTDGQTIILDYIQTYELFFTRTAAGCSTKGGVVG
jgi:hypothetical protein